MVVSLTDDGTLGLYVDWRREIGGRRGVPTNNTIMKELRTLLAALRHWKDITNSGMRLPQLPRMRVKRPLPNVPTERMLALVVDKAIQGGEHAVALAVALAGEMCVRKGGYQSIVAWAKTEAGGYFDLEAQEVTFQQTKKHDETWRRLSYAHAPQVQKAVRAALAAHPDRPPELGTSRGFDRALRWSGLAGYGYNLTSFRHLMIERAKNSGLTEWECAAITGHATSDLVLRVYGQVGDRTANAAMARIKEVTLCAIPS